MKRNKIRPKYLELIRSSSNNKVSTIIDNTEKKLIKFVISILLITLMLFWGVIPSIILYILGIDPSTLNDTVKYSIVFVNDLLLIGLLILIYYKTVNEDFKKYFNHNFKNNFKQSIVYWLIGFGAMIFSNYIIAIVMNGQLTENEESVRSMIDMAPLYMGFQLVIYAPFVEEIIFRKSIRDFVSNKWVYAILSGFIFGGLHVLTSITDITSLLYLIPYCSLGFVFALLYTKSNNIFSSIMVHAIHNSLALVLYLVSI